MKPISNEYKNALLSLGREYDAKITYGNTVLTNAELNEVSPHYNADLMKSVMKQLDLDSNVEIPIGTEINCQFGLKVGNSYEYIDYGNYIVYSSEKQEDLLSYRIVCYDKMLYAMKDYEDLEITYPISIKDYISAIATKIGLTFDDEGFTNADKEIPEEKYLDEDGNTLGYTYRDVLDELAQVTASIIKVEDNKLRITYPDDVIAETSIFENTSGTITTDSKKVLDLEVEGNTYQEQTSGKNLFNSSNGIWTGNSAGKVAYDSVNDEFTFHRDSGADYLIRTGSFSLKPNTTYTLYFDVSSNTMTNDFLFINSSSVLTGGSARTIVPAGQTGKFTASLLSNSTLSATYELWLYCNSTGTLKAKVMLIEGSYTTQTIPPYEPYTYGPTPNPNYPQPINVVTGNQEVEVCGKNWFHISRVIVPNATTTYEKFNDNKISITTSASQTYKYIEIPLNVLSNVNYYFKATFTNSNTSLTALWFAVVDATKSYVLTNASYTSGTQRSFNTGSNELIYLRLYVTGNVAGLNTALWENIQLTQESNASYEPYIGTSYNVDLPVENLLNVSDITLEGKGYVFNLSNLTIPNGTYTLNVDTTYSLLGVACLDKDGNEYFNGNKSFPLVINATNGIKTLRVYNGNSAGGTFSNIQLEPGSKANPYTPYGTTPIELCKIGNYKDRIFKGVGSNLFKGYNNMETGFLPTSGSYPTTNSTYPNARYQLIELKAGESITTSNSTSSKGRFRYIDKETNQVVGTITNTTNAYFTSTGTYLNGFVSGTITAVKDFIVGVMLIQNEDTQFMINYGTTALPYEPYNAKDKWYIEKRIASRTFNGSENGWGVANTGTANWYYYLTYTTLGQSGSSWLSNYYPMASIGNSDTRQGICVVGSYFRIRWGTEDTIANYKTWLNTHNVKIYWVQNVSTYTEITNEELISQLNSIELLDGLNNISITSANLSSPLKISYISEYETITEDYLKDTNVNFSEKFGPVNSLVLSRSADSDLIYRKDDSSIEKNGLTEIKISDNQILNGNDRDEYIDNIFNKLKGLEYYTNDYDSTGITYLDLGDFYKVEARGNRYLALMLNDELNVTQGFEELIHTDKPDTSVSDYKKADTTDRRINQATLIVDKQNQTIQALTSRTSNLESKQINDKAELLAKFGDYALDSRVDDITTQVETLQTDTYTKTEVKSILKGTFYDSDNNQIVSEVVKTTSGTFDENGMHYEKTNAKTKSTINEVGVRVDNAINDSELLFAGYDDNINQTIVRTDNLTVRNFLVVGSQSRFQDYEENNEQGTGVFDL